MILLHGPDGRELWVAPAAIKAIRPIPGGDGQGLAHVAHGTGAVLYLGQPRALGVREKAGEVLSRIKACD